MSSAKKIFDIHPHVNPGVVDEASYTWKPLEFLNAFRFLISFFFSALYFTDQLFPPLGSSNPDLFFATSMGYLALSVAFTLMLRWRQPGFGMQTSLQLGVDVIAILLLMHSSGGVSSGVGNLLIITVTGASVVLGGRYSLFFVSLVTLAVLTEQSYSEYTGLSASGSYTQAGFLGLTLFVTAVVARLFARKIRESEALAEKRGLDLANMAELTEHIIQRMQTGIVVIDGDNRVRLINESAWYMLGMPSTAGAPDLHNISMPLARQLEKWNDNPDTPSSVIQPSSSYANVMPRFARLSQKDPKNQKGTLIFLEDTSAMEQKAQQLQLASLGRLTASIAHEIRNPLGAISHAGQLLAESPNIDEKDARLTRIIKDQSSRMNTIIESVLQLGRRTKTQPELIELKSFVQNFVRDFLHNRQEAADTIGVLIEPDSIQIRFDVTHFQQILTNLCENALRHSNPNQRNPKVIIRGGLSLDLSRPHIDVIDHGSGIDEETANHIFEPFYTTSSSGSGLGLYISRELAECNQARLNYLSLASQGSCFRLSFQDPRRHMH